MKHIPVMKKESINGLNILPNGNYIDATFGFWWSFKRDSLKTWR